MQLVAYGAQDIYLTGNPQITFFKVVYRRHTNFSMESISQTLSGAGTANGNTSTCTISRNGDLVHKVYVTATPSDEAFTTFDGSKLISEVELEIGGQKIDKHTSEWNDIWNELSTDESKAIGFKAMQGSIGLPGTSTTGVDTINVPLNFWFCRNPGLALPLIALQYHEVKLKFKWGSQAIIGDGSTALSPKVWCDYIYLDTDERRRFAQVSHEYLIEQLQIESMTNSSGDKKINFNHPVKELIWTSEDDYGTAQLKLNGHDRFQKQEREYFQLRQPFDYHTAVPRQNLPSAAQLSSNMLTKSGTSIAVTTCTQVENEVTATKGLGDDASTESLEAANTMCAFIGSDFNRFDYAAAGQVTAAADTSIAAYAAGIAAGTAGIALADASALQIALKDLTGRQLELTGTNFQNPDANSTTTTTVTLLQVVPGLGGDAADSADTVDSTITMLFFDKQVLKVGDAGAVDSGGATTISSFKVFEPVNTLASEARTSKMTKAINVYSFALKPEEHQPSGTCNFSRIDNAQLNFAAALDGSNSQNLYAVNYNVLRIMSGMGGLAYSN